jgi:S-adenosylmethionine:tRNA ribosyltransferase-isomerase
MKTSDFDYQLPEELIAQTPLTDRSASRLLVVDRKTGDLSHDIFHNLTHHLLPNDVLVLNDTKVLPARLYGLKRETNALIEVLLLTELGHD